MVPSDVTWHQPKQTNYGAEWRHAARKWTAQLPDKCSMTLDLTMNSSGEKQTTKNEINHFDCFKLTLLSIFRISFFVSIIYLMGGQE